MAWNRPENGEAVSRPLHKKSSLKRSGDRFPVRGAIAGAIVVLGAAVAAWYFGRTPARSAERSVERKPSRIAEVRPSIASNAVVRTEEAPEEKKDTRKTYRDERGILRYEGSMRVSGQRPVGKPVDIWANRPKIFKHDAEETIADFVKMRLGDPVIGDLTYGEEFVRSFKEALVDPTFTSEKDDAETRELKKAVTETMSDLNARMKAGEDIAQILNDTRREYQALGQYRHELEVQLHEIRNDSENLTDEDLADFTEAANRLLKEKGLPPLSLPRAVALSLKAKGIRK